MIISTSRPVSRRVLITASQTKPGKEGFNVGLSKREME